MKRGELAATSGCNAETIRYYEKIGLIPEPRRAANGYREYSEIHKGRLHFVQRGRELVFTIDDLTSLLTSEIDTAFGACQIDREIAWRRVDLAQANFHQACRVR